MNEIDEIFKNIDKTKKSKKTYNNIISLGMEVIARVPLFRIRLVLQSIISVVYRSHHNESYPIGLSIIPTENEDIYEQLVTSRELFRISPGKSKTKFLLSDMLYMVGSSI